MPGSPSRIATRPRPARTIWNASSSCLELRVAADHRAGQPDLLQAALATGSALQAEHAVEVDRLGLALDLDLAEVLEVERAGDEALGHRRDRATVPGCAAVCIRAATFTASPSAVYS